MRSARVGVALCAMAAALTACAVFASKAELRLVERMRAETDPLLRLEILDDYDSQFATTGRMGERVDPLRPGIEEGLWRYADDTGLGEAEVRSYLERYPEGIHAEEAQRRLDQIRYFAEADAAAQAVKARAEEAERARIEAERERQRAKVRGGLERWLRAALSIPRWGTTLDALLAIDEDFRELWSGEPEPVCVRDTCRRTLQAEYFFARTGGTRIDRSATLVLQVDMREGRVYQIIGYYSGRGFVDWLEMGGDELIEEETLEQREAARDAMVGMAQAAISSLLMTASEVETEEEGVLLRFRRGDLEVSLREFPPSFVAGRVDGFQVTFSGDLAAAAAPPAPEE